LSNTKTNKLLISGYYGFNNIGDESILRAVVDNLKEKLGQIEITVLSQDPASTIEKYGVHAVNRKSVVAIIKAVNKCDILISGGGSLLQDVTSKRSIFYYLFIMWIAKILRKKVLIYSQGIGPINSKFNREITYKTLNRVDGIVVRDDASKELLVEIGIPEKKVVVTADPVLRIKPVSLETGRIILEREGFIKNPDKITVGFAIRERNLNSKFVDQLCVSMNKLIEKYQVEIVLIPFHYSEDLAVIDKIEKKLENRVSVIRHKYLTNEMLSIIGNMDFLVGVRLHALIHAAIMEIPMIAISYDPKVNSFMHSIGLRAMCSIYDFDNEYFIEEFEKIWKNKDALKIKTREKIEELIKNLDTNEEIIKGLMEK
jgi:polysaccharide pyruvyl transferase CsaB